MGFLPIADSRIVKRSRFGTASLEFLQAHGCDACDLKNAPKAWPIGSDEPLIYMLGEAPGREEAEQGEPFVGKSGRMLKGSIPRRYLDHVRYGNVIQSRPPDNRNPSPQEIASCRGYLIEDIEATQPKAIFGFGAVALQAITKQTGVTRLLGRIFPVKVGTHTCWYVPFLHPAYIMRLPDRDRQKVEEAFRRQMVETIAKIENRPEAVIVTEEEAWYGVDVLDDVGLILDHLDEAMTFPVNGFDYETNRLRPYNEGARILSVGISSRARAFSFPLHHPKFNWSVTDRARLVNALKGYFLHPVRKVSHNLAFEAEWTLEFFGKEAIRPAYWEDSQAQAFLLGGFQQTLSLDHQCRELFGLALKDMTNMDRKSLAEADPYEVCSYNALDAKYHLKVFERLALKIEHEGLQEVYNHQIERTLSAVRMQARGILVDPKANAELVTQYEGQVAKALAKFRAVPDVQAYEEKTGTVLNPGSAVEVKAALHHAGVHVESTAEEVLGTIKHPMIRPLKEWRSATKSLSTYVSICQEGSPLIYDDGRLHPQLQTANTRTNRTASDGPNIQNWPKRSEELQKLRRQLVASAGHWLVSVDYSSIQARNVAMESRDPALVQAFIEDYDIHADWRERIRKLVPSWGKTGQDEKALRHLAKNKFVFPSFFGAQPGSLARYLGIELNDAYKLHDKFWEMFPEIKNWQERLRKFYDKEGYVTGLSGFRRYAPVGFTEVINTPIQSDEALLVCDAMNRLAAYEDDDLMPIMMIHDDLSFEIAKERFDECVDVILLEMTRVEYPWINVPIGVELSRGENWCDQQDIGKYKSDDGVGYEEVGE